MISKQLVDYTITGLNLRSIIRFWKICLKKLEEKFKPTAFRKSFRAFGTDKAGQSLDSFK